MTADCDPKASQSMDMHKRSSGFVIFRIFGGPHAPSSTESAGEN